MNDGIFSLSMSTNTLEERITSKITTTTTINTIMTQEEEEGGRKSGSSSYYSTSSASSSAENISNVGSGELFIFTFMTAGGQRSGPIFPASDSTISYHRHASNISRPHHHHISCSSTSPSSHAASQPCSNCRKEPPTHSTYPVNCFYTRPCNSHDLCDWRSSSDSKWRETDFCSNPSRCFDSQDFWSSPQSLRFDGSHKYSYKKNNASCPHRDRNNHPFQSLIEDLFRIIPDNTEGTLLRSMEKGGKTTGKVTKP